MKASIILLIFLFSSQIHSQSLKGIYTRQQLNGRGDNTTLPDKAKKIETFSYVYSQKKSIQKLISNQKTSTDTTYIEKNGDKIPTVSTVRFSSAVVNYKDFDLKTYKVLITSNGVDSNVKINLPVHNWKLSNETKVINGFTCKKATTKNTEFNANQNITAWYTEEIPVNDGPMFYNGLPGFIIQLELDDKSILIFQKLAFSEENTTIELPNNTAKEMSFEEYLAQRR
ncbi:GLPGLI family protein [Flavobacterium sp. F-65]|jgi:GLPGLI family protein|uniref:GLPGLI family protein n=1 Tax=Flavobacterium pisciphilum TaxID=2893755 RepID=A0ABS8MUT3_9FLAO|nr:GLPGLI family protein [Flavobacterium sp. F-65]MCC9071951.1 GLPGLI family protein [Flavobacterium sp. F-65]